ncbi:hypothetical protein [Dyadobacter sp. 32]|uniref:hypothetical protein n=1 Tax=Dyadobacter sp. 32 TaxID=538966 RepID=UPI0039C627DA
MDIMSEKIELARRLLDTQDRRVLDAIRSVFNNSDAIEEWGDLPDNVITYVKESIKQIDSNQGIPHDKARESYKKWL